MPTLTSVSPSSAPPPIPDAPISTRDQIISQARSMPDLIAKASLMDPPLAAALTGQATAASATPLGALIAAGVAWLAAHYGLGWGESFDNMVAGLAIVGGGYLTHWWQARSAGPKPTDPAAKAG